VLDLYSLSLSLYIYIYIYTHNVLSQRHPHYTRYSGGAKRKYLKPVCVLYVTHEERTIPMYTITAQTKACKIPKLVYIHSNLLDVSANHVTINRDVQYRG